MSPEECRKNEAVKRIGAELRRLYKRGYEPKLIELSPSDAAKMGTFPILGVWVQAEAAVSEGWFAASGKRFAIYERLHADPC